MKDEDTYLKVAKILYEVFLDYDTNYRESFREDLKHLYNSTLFMIRDVYHYPGIYEYSNDTSEVLKGRCGLIKLDHTFKHIYIEIKAYQDIRPIILSVYFVNNDNIDSPLKEALGLDYVSSSYVVGALGSRGITNNDKTKSFLGEMRERLFGFNIFSKKASKERLIECNIRLMRIINLVMSGYRGKSGNKVSKDTHLKIVK